MRSLSIVANEIHVDAKCINKKWKSDQLQLHLRADNIDIGAVQTTINSSWYFDECTKRSYR
jgi:hypothetical protein